MDLVILVLPAAFALAVVLFPFFKFTKLPIRIFARAKQLRQKSMGRLVIAHHGGTGRGSRHTQDQRSTSGGAHHHGPAAQVAALTFAQLDALAIRGYYEAVFGD